MDQARRVVAQLRSQLPIAVLAGEQVVVLALSGGRDSMVLWWALRRLGLRSILWHGDHQWREESAADAQWIQQQAQAHKAKLQIDVLLKKTTQNPAAARQWRYQCLQAVAASCSERGVACVLTAHHADDQAESVLANIRRGWPHRFVRYCCQAKVLRACPVLRPLLASSRQDLISG